MRTAEPQTGRPVEVLVCFAVKEEAKPFKKLAESRRNISTLLTGMGPRNAEAAVRAALAARRPGLVLSCGFAGGLNSELASGTVVFEVDKETGLEPRLIGAGAQRCRFHTMAKVATTAEQKRALRETTRADAVEMESRIICEICREQNIPSGTIRVILDTAQEELPLDFNQLMTAEQEMNYGKLARALMRSPGKIRGLLRLQKQARMAAERLAAVLTVVLTAKGTGTG